MKRKDLSQLKIVQSQVAYHLYMLRKAIAYRKSHGGLSEAQVQAITTDLIFMAKCAAQNVEDLR